MTDTHDSYFAAFCYVTVTQIFLSAEEYDYQINRCGPKFIYDLY